MDGLATPNRSAITVLVRQAPRDSVDNIRSSKLVLVTE